MIKEIFKFPATLHLANLTSMNIRENKILSAIERQKFLSKELIVEEKIDGACLGISFDEHGNLQAQNRGAYLPKPANGQWKKLWEWLEWRTDLLLSAIGGKYIIFGEWCYAKHSVYYTRLPDWFIGFDVYDKEVEKFMSCDQRNEILSALNFPVIPALGKGHYTFDDLHNFFQQSQFSNEQAEGIYLRHDSGDWLQQRAKLVNPNFVQTIEKHWSQGKLQVNTTAA